MEITNRIFVYGTLKRGGRLHNQIKHLEFKDTATINTVSLYKKRGVPFPFARFNEDSIGCSGEIYELQTPRDLTHLDFIEDTPRLYVRKTIEINNEPCWIYVLSDKVWDEWKNKAIEIQTF